MRRVPFRGVNRPFQTLADVRELANWNRRQDASAQQFRAAFGDAASDAVALNTAAQKRAAQGESFTRPGVICDLNQIQAMPGSAEDRYKAYCDCAFLELRTTTELTINGSIFPPPPPNMTDAQYDAQMKQMITGLVTAGRTDFSVKVHVWTSRGVSDSMWHKCMSGLCASPDGCYNAQKAASGAIGDEAKDAFNVHPFIAYPPWDDVGAAARGIPKRNANGWYTFGQLFTYDAKAYDPIELWKILWTNPALFGLLGLKAGLIPFNPMIAYFVSGGLGVLPAAMQEISQKPGGLSPENMGKYLFEPSKKGWIKFAKLIATFLPKCGFGFISGCAAGVLLQQAAQDQLEIGEDGHAEIEKVLDPFSRAVIVYFSKYGSRLVDMVFGVAQMASHLRADPSLIQFLATTMGQIQNFPGVTFAPVEKLALGIATKLLNMAAVIAVDIAADREADVVVDDAVYSLLGFKPSLLWKLGKQGADIVLKDAASSSGVSLSQLPDLVAQLGPILQQMVQAIQDINHQLNGGLEDLISLFNSVKGALDGSTQAATRAVAMATAGQIAPPPPQQSQLQPNAGGGNSAQVTASSSAPLMAAGAGFMVGGPVGALIGLGAGLVLSRGQTITTLTTQQNLPRDDGLAPAQVISSGGVKRPLLGRYGRYGAAAAPATSARQAPTGIQIEPLLRAGLNPLIRMQRTPSETSPTGASTVGRASNAAQDVATAAPPPVASTPAPTGGKAIDINTGQNYQPNIVNPGSADSGERASTTSSPVDNAIATANANPKTTTAITLAALAGLVWFAFRKPRTQPRALSYNSSRRKRNRRTAR